MTTFAMHQPNYIPWLGYFYKMFHCDVFVYLDTVQYPQGRSFSARNRIKTPQGATYLTIPVQLPHGHGRTLYSEVAFANDTWREKHLRSVALSYKRAPYFDEIYPLYEAPLRSQQRFVDLNIALIEAFAAYLGISSRRVRLSELPGDFGHKSKLIADIGRALEASVYLSGTGGGKVYNDTAVLHEHGIELIYSKFEYPRYTQLWNDFTADLSILDVLFNCGPETRRLLES